jgi:uncharacterized protein (UPF0332 family)
MTGEEKQEIITYRIRRAKETLQEVKSHIDNELWSTAINRIYYACFYAVSALLLKHDIQVRSHAGTRHLFGLHFIKSEIIPKDLGKFYSDIYDMRHTGDYDDFVDFTKEDVLDVIEPANNLISSIDILLKS